MDDDPIPHEPQHVVDDDETAEELLTGRYAWRRVAGRLVLLTLSGAVFYFLIPQVVDVWAAFPGLRTYRPLWFPVMIALEVASFACVWQLQRFAVHGLSWFLSATSQVAANAVSRVIPGGLAVGGAVQFHMLSRGGCDPGAAGSALTAISLLTTGAVFSLPVVVLPAFLFGQPAPAGLGEAALVGAGLFGALAALGLALARSDRLVRFLGRLIGRAMMLMRHKPPGDLPDLLVDRRNQVLTALGARWPAAVMTSAGKWGLDYLALLAALAGAHQHPRPSLVLLAYTAASVLAMIPITPGGLGFVEAGLTGTLTLAGVPATAAALATLAYRLVSFWLPLAAGPPAWFAFRRRYG